MPGGEAIALRGPRRSSATPSARGSYLQPRPAGNDRLRLDVVDHDELLAARRTGDDPDGASSDADLLGEQLDECLVGGAAVGRCGDTGAEDSLDDSLDSVGPGPRGQADGEPDVGVSQGSARQGTRDRRYGMALHEPSLPAPHPRSPNSARPTRTIVAPSSTATG